MVLSKHEGDPEMKWEPIYDSRYDPRYSVSDAGMVRNDITGKILKPYGSGGRGTNEYLKVGLCYGTIVSRKQQYVHRLVAEAFVERPMGPDRFHKREVNHKDCDTHNNRAENLEWCSRSENEQHKQFMTSHLQIDRGNSQGEMHEAI